MSLQLSKLAHPLLSTASDAAMSPSGPGKLSPPHKEEGFGILYRILGSDWNLVPSLR